MHHILAKVSRYIMYETLPYQCDQCPYSLKPLADGMAFQSPAYKATTVPGLSSSLDVIFDVSSARIMTSLISGTAKI